jgi:hypothetical protein
MQVYMRPVASVLSWLLALLSASVGLMAVSLMLHALLTPQSRLPRLHDEGPGVVLRFGIGGVCAAVVLGLLSYLLARAGSSADGNGTRDKPR